MTINKGKYDGTGRLAGKIAVVTGSSSGHGRAISFALAREGAAVICADLQKKALPQGFEEQIEVDTDDLILERGGKAFFINADVANSGDLDSVARIAVEEFAKLDIWVNNAGIFLGLKSIIDESEENFMKTIRVNLMGTWLGCKVAIRQMLRQEISGRSRGKIINIGSIAGEIGQPDLGSYAASKGAVHNLSRSLAIEYAPSSINVNTIAPRLLPNGYESQILGRPRITLSSKETSSLAGDGDARRCRFGSDLLGLTRCRLDNWSHSSSRRRCSG